MIVVSLVRSSSSIEMPGKNRIVLVRGRIDWVRAMSIARVDSDLEGRLKGNKSGRVIRRTNTRKDEMF